MEQDACIGYLRRQTALIRPKIIVCLGRVAGMRIIKEEQPTIEEQVFDNLCSMTLSVRNSKADIVLGRLKKVEGAIIDVLE